MTHGDYPPPDERCARCGHPARDHDEDYIDVRTRCLAEGCACLHFERAPEEITIDQVGCARCLGDGHPALTFRRLAHPVELGGHPLTHWAPCPTNGEPILLEMTPAYRLTLVGGA